MAKPFQGRTTLLNRNFYADSHNPKWVTDISSIPTKQGLFTFLSSAVCLASASPPTKPAPAKISNWRWIRSAQQWKKEVAAELPLHSDQGFQYASQSDFALTTQYYHIVIAPKYRRKIVGARGTYLIENAHKPIH